MLKYDHQTIHQLLETQAVANSTNIALTDGCGFSLNYSNLLKTVDAVIGDLYLAGVDPRDRIALVMPNGINLAITLLAVSSFATAAPLNPSYKAEEFESYFSELRVKWLVLLDGYETPALEVAHALKMGIIRLSSGSLKLVSDKKRAGLISSVGSIAARPDDICLILLTSGSTGRSKKVPLTHRNVLTSTAHICETLLLSSADKCLCMWEQFHIGGLVDLLLVPLASGGNTVCAGGFNAHRLFEFVGTDITWFQAVPTTLHELTVHTQKVDNQIKCPKLRFIRSVASTLSPALMQVIESLFGVPVLQTLGMTEAGPLITTNRLPPGRRKAGSVGLAAGPEIKIAGPDGKALPQGSIGEIAIRGENVFAGYEDASDANSESFHDGWFHTGDTGYFDADGFLFLAGRIKEMVNRGGEKITLQEIDDVLQLHPKIAQAAAFSVKHQTLGEDIGVAVVMKPGQQLSPTEIRAYVGQHLANFKIPQRVYFLDKMPREPGGKINRLSLATKAENLITAQDEQDNHQLDDIERRIAHIWASELNLSQVGPRDNFFEIGGHSLAGVRVLLAIEQEFNHQLSQNVWSSLSTVGEMGKIIRRDLVETIPKPEAPKSLFLPDNYFRAIAMVMSSGLIRTMPDDPTIKIMNPEGKKAPLVWAFNSPDMEMTGLSRHWNSDQPLLGLYSGGGQLPRTDDALNNIAAHYAERLLTLFPQGNFALGGNCRGGRLAHKILTTLNARKVFPSRVIFMEYANQSLLDYPGEVMFLLGKQSLMSDHLSADTMKVVRGVKLTKSKSVHWLEGLHGQFFRAENVTLLTRRILAFLDATEGVAKLA